MDGSIERVMIHQIRDKFMLWPDIQGLEKINSPGLLVDPDRVARNVDRMMKIVGGPKSVARLRPHVKTHKMPAAIRVQMDAGITQFKTATLPETEMVATEGAPDVLLAHQVVGPKVDQLISLIGRFPKTRFSTIVDDENVVREIAKRLCRSNGSIDLLIDIDCGMHRTGTTFGVQVDRLRERIEATDCVSFGGLHVYDGHIHDASLEARREAVAPIIESVNMYVEAFGSPVVVGGGTPTFAILASDTDWQCSPGTSVLWDIGYGGDYPDLAFEVAAVLVTRIISKRGPGKLCFDIGHKAISAEMPLGNRLILPQIDDATLTGQSEEHLVVSTSHAEKFSVGDTLLAYPRHICPTVALYPEAWVIRSGQVTEETWSITARGH